tara:strand:+ start:5146 stop:6147 length:1002 start_codon:yes stop_codon:yes gene_type:complete
MQCRLPLIFVIKISLQSIIIAWIVNHFLFEYLISNTDKIVINESLFMTIKMPTNEDISSKLLYIFTIVLLSRKLLLIKQSLLDILRLTEQYTTGNLDYKIDSSNDLFLDHIISKHYEMADSLKSIIIKQNIIYNSLPHDLRTPLSSIQITSDIISSQSNNNFDLTQRLTRQVNSLNLICENNLYLYKSIMGKLHLEKSGVSLIDLIEHNFHIMTSDIVLNIHGENYEMVLDTRVYNIIIQNIISNAIKHSKSEVSVYTSRYNKTYILRFVDDGPGFKGDLLLKETRKPGYYNSKNSFGIGLFLIFELSQYINSKVFISNNISGGGCITLAIQE